MGFIRVLFSLFHWSVKRWFQICCCLGLMSMTWLTYKLNTSPVTVPHIQSHAQDLQLSTLANLKPYPHQTQHVEEAKSPLTVQNKALLILKPRKTSSISEAMLHARFKFNILYYKENNLTPLTNNDMQGYYSVIVFEDLQIYLTMSAEDRTTIDNYCRRYKVGVIYFTEPRPDYPTEEHNFPLSISFTPSVFSTYTIEDTPLTAIARPLVVHSMNQVKQWITFQPNHQTYKTLAMGGLSATDEKPVSLAVIDQGQHDGIKRVFFGHFHMLWIHKILYLDALSYLTGGAMKISKTRLVQVDMDDMFLGKNGTKMNREDVLEMKNAQAIWRKHYVPGFNFFIGFNARAYQTGSTEERLGDEEIVKQAAHFKWFDHTYSHVKAHTLNFSLLVDQMQQSKEFARAHNMTVSHTYSVAPHHSGVYPVHEPLYDAWKQVWGIQVTSTEEYLHLKPPWKIKGFIYKDIRVLPRQVCGLFTHTMKRSLYPKGPAALENNILGGALFDTLLYNYLNIYMTHIQNYGNDRLAIYTFNKLFKLFSQSTTLQMQGRPPLQMADMYFNKYPTDVDPIWLNPCDDKRHLEIWHGDKKCGNLPSVLVVGPQKTGSTALYEYLRLHPNIVSNGNSPTSFEELQFFGSANYKKGLDWYMQFFQRENNSCINFEKSATYFDKEAAVLQAHSLLPRAKIIIILLDPILRAQSWYYHQRAHNDSAAMSLSFPAAVKNEHKSKSAQVLKSRMIKPGFYYQHIQRWRQLYPDEQILYLDGEKLKKDPVQVMSEVQEFIGVKVKVDYRDLISFDSKKGFYCVKRSSGNTHCLGSGKGRSKKYGDVEPEARQYLEQVFATPNLYLKQLLTELSVPLPSWLQT